MHEHRNILLTEAVERYVNGEMNPDERLHFENLRKADSEVDQLVVEHTNLLQKLNRYNEWQKFRNSLNKIHAHMEGMGEINIGVRSTRKTKLIYLINRYKKTTAIAASIAGLTALVVTAIILSVTPKRQSGQFEILKKNINSLEHRTRMQDREIRNLKEGRDNTIEIPFTKGGTGFIIDSRGLLVTNNHVVENAKNVVVSNAAGEEFYTKVVFSNPATDIAILKIDDKDFKTLPAIPYGFDRKSADLAEPIFTMGYPREEIVYGQGYLSSRTGYNGDTLSCQIDIPANRGNSGSPILNYRGEVIGILSGRQKDVEGVVFAIRSSNIFNALSSAKENEDSDSTLRNLKLNNKSSLASLNRTQQVKKLQDYVFQVKVN